jgi:hypothetical protein
MAEIEPYGMGGARLRELAELVVHRRA